MAISGRDANVDSLRISVTPNVSLELSASSWSAGFHLSTKIFLSFHLCRLDPITARASRRPRRWSRSGRCHRQG